MTLVLLWWFSAGFFLGLAWIALFVREEGGFLNLIAGLGPGIIALLMISTVLWPVAFFGILQNLAESREHNPNP